MSVSSEAEDKSDNTSFNLTNPIAHTRGFLPWALSNTRLNSLQLSGILCRRLSNNANQQETFAGSILEHLSLTGVGVTPLGVATRTRWFGRLRE
jgi:hypothetical protein